MAKSRLVSWESIVQLRKSEEGSFTLEASLVFPIIILITFTLLVFCLHIFQEGYLYYKATMTAERAAFNWTNSYRDGETGILAVDNPQKTVSSRNYNDGLYWRFFQDNEESFPVFTGSELPACKINKAAATLINSGSGWVDYTNTVVRRRNISMMLMDKGNILGMQQPQSAGSMFPVEEDAFANVSISITEPVEFMRDVDFFTGYIPKKIMGKSLKPTSRVAGIDKDTEEVLISLLQKAGNFSFAAADIINMDNNIINSSLQSVLSEMALKYVSQEEHYNERMLKNNCEDFPPTLADAEEKGWIQMEDWESVLHRIGTKNEENTKFISPDGHYEAVYDSEGQLVTDPVNMGTYNYCSNRESSMGHLTKDVLPYIAWGNSPDEPTTCLERLNYFVTIGGGAGLIHALLEE